MSKKTSKKKTWTWKKVLLGFVWAIVLIIVLAFTLTAGLPKAANSFLTEVTNGNIETAYKQTAGQFQAQTSLTEFDAFVNQIHLKDYKSARRSNREIENNQWLLEWTLTLNDDSQIPLVIEFVKEDNSRKIYTMYVPKGWLTNNNPSTKTNNQDETVQLEDLIAESMEQFASAVNQKDFSDFYAYVSKLRQEQITVEEFNQIFAAFIDQEINLSGISKQTPQLQEPDLSQQWVVAIKWSYPYGEGVNVYFSLSYIEEDTRKLVGIEVFIK